MAIQVFQEQNIPESWQKLNDTDKPAEVLVADYVAARRAEGKKAFIDGPHFELA